MSLEVVLVVPVLMLLALFVLWAGRGGRAALITDLAAEEAAAAAALACEEHKPACEELVADVLRARPGLEFLCIGGPRPAPGNAEILNARWLGRSDFEVPPQDTEVTGLGMLDVSFVCETDGAVAPLRGVFPTVTFRGQASEVAILQGPPKVGVEDVAVAEGTAPAPTTLTFTLTLDAPAPQVVTLTYSIVGGGYASGEATEIDDYTPPSPSQVTLSQGDTSATIDVQIIADDLYEAHETFELVLDPPPLSNPLDPNSVPLVNIPDPTAVATILNDDDLPAITVSGAAQDEGVALNFDVSLGAPVGRDVEVSIFTADDSAGTHPATGGSSCVSPLATIRGTDPPDYIAIGAGSRTLTFAPTPGPNPPPARTATVTPCDDLIGEPDETLLLGWESHNARLDGTRPSGEAVGTIRDNEPRLRVDADCATDAIDPVSALEAAGQLVFRVCRTRPNFPNSPADPVVRVSYRTVRHPSSGGNPAAEPDDYAAALDTLTFQANQTQLDVTVSVVDDTLDEYDETLRLELYDPSDNASIEVDPAYPDIGTIVDDDDPPDVRVSDVTAPETDDPNLPDDARLSFVVELSQASGKTVTVQYETEDDTEPARDSATAGDDYTAVASSSIDITAGDTTETITVDLIDDTIDEADSETLVLRLTSAFNAGFESPLVDPADPCPQQQPDDPLTPVNEFEVSGRDDCALGAITDDDDPPYAVVADATAQEGDDLRFTVGLFDASGDPVTSQRAVTVGYQLEVGTALIADFDPGSSTDFSWLVDPPEGSLVINPPAREQTVALRAGTDNVYEPNPETFTLRLTAPADANAQLHPVGNPCQSGTVIDDCAVGTITEAGGAPAASVAAPAVDTPEDRAGPFDGNVMNFEATLDRMSTVDSTVRYRTVPSTAAGDATGRALPGYPADYLTVPGHGNGIDYGVVTYGVVTIPAGRLRALLPVRVFDDGIDEADETVRVELLAPRTGDNVTLAPNPRDRAAEGTIADDDTIWLRFVDTCTDPGDDPGATLDACADEDDPSGHVEFTIGLFDPDSPDPNNPNPATTTEDVTVTVRAFDGDAQAGSDYTAPNPTATIDAGSETTTIRVPVLDDTDNEADETFQIRLVGDANTLATIDDPSGQGAILNDDDPPQVRIADAAAVTEGAPAQFAVSLYDAGGNQVEAGQDIHIAWEIRHRTAAGEVTDGDDFAGTDAGTGTDFNDASGTLIISKGERDPTLVVRTGADALFEGGAGAAEHFEVHLVAVTDSGGVDDLNGVTATLGAAGANPCAAGTHTDACARGSVTDDDAAPVVRLLQAAGEAAGVGAAAVEGDPGEAGGQLVFSVGLFDPDTGAATSSGRDAVVAYSVGDTDPGDVPDDPAGLSPAVGGALSGGVWTPAGSDYAALASAAVTVPAGDETAALAAVAARPDNVDETDEVLSVTLLAAGTSGAVLDSGGAGTGSFGVITDDDTATLRLVDGCHFADGDDDPGAADPEDPADPGAGEGDYQACAEEGSALSFGLELSEEVSLPVTLRWWVQPTGAAPAALPGAPGADVAAAGLGLAAAKREFTIPANTQTASIPVGTVDDDVFEADETLLLRIEAIPGTDLNASLGDSSSVGAILNDDDPPQVRIADAAAVTEGDPGTPGGPASFAVTLTDSAGTESPSVADVHIAWQVRHTAPAGGAATDGSDLAATTGTLIITAGATSGAIDVAVAADALFEGGAGAAEHFEVHLVAVTDSGGVDDLNGVTATLGAAGANPCAAGTHTDACARGSVTDDDAAPALSVSAPAAAVAEGGFVEFTVSLDAASGREATVEYATSVAADSPVSQGAACGSDPASMPDLVEASDTLTFDPADSNVAARTSQTVRVQSCDDSLDEDDEEAFELRLSAETGASLAGADASATGLIADNDPLPLLGVAPARATATEGGTLEFTVSLSEASSRRVAVDYYTVHGRGAFTASDSDYAAVAEASAVELVFEPGDALAQTVRVATVDDDITEGEERFQLRLKDFTNAAQGDAFAVGAILDDCIDPAQTDTTADNYGAPALSVGDDAVSVSEGDSLTVTVTLAAALCVDAVVSARGAAGTAGLWDAPITGAGEMVHARVDAYSLSVDLEVPTLEDAVFEGDEAFTLHLNWNRDSDPYDDVDPLGGHFPDIGGTGDVAVAVTVTDDDSVPHVSAAAASASEGDDDIEFTVSLDALSALPVSVNYWTRDLTGAGAATADVDYDKIDSGSAAALTLPATAVDSAASLSSDGSVAYAAAPAAQTAAVGLIDDTASEGDERFQLRLALAAGSTDRATVTPIAVGTIVDDDCVNPANPAHSVPALSFVTDPVAVDEDAAAVSLQVQIAPVLCEGATTGDLMSFTTVDGTATAGFDFFAASGQRDPGAGVRRVDFTVDLIDDDVPEPDESFEFQVAWRGDDAPARFRSQAPVSTTVNIADHEHPTIGFTQNEYSLLEADADLVFNLELSTAAPRTVTVRYRTEELSRTEFARAGQDYTHTEGTLTVNAGASTATIAVPILADDLYEAGERFQLRLYAPTGADLADSAALGWIRDDDGDKIPDLLFPDPADVEEGEDVLATVRLNRPSGRIARFHITRCANQTATQGADYRRFDRRNVVIPPGETEWTLTIETIDDNIQEDTESICIIVWNPFRATINGSPDRNTFNIVNIEDNDSAEAEFSVTGPRAPAEEGEPLTFTVILSEALTEDVTVRAATSDGTATATTDTTPGDYTAVDETLTFAAGETYRTVQVATTDDDDSEDFETVTLTLTDASAPSGVDPDADTAEGTIADNDRPLITVEAHHVCETDGSLSFTVAVDPAAAAGDDDTTVGYRTVAGSHTVAGTHFTHQEGTLAFGPGVTVQLVDVPVTNNQEDNPTRSVRLELHDPVNANIGAGHHSTPGQIYDDEGRRTLHFPNVWAYEGDPLVYSAVISEPACEPVRVWVVYEHSAAHAWTGSIPARYGYGGPYAPDLHGFTDNASPTFVIDEVPGWTDLGGGAYGYRRGVGVMTIPRLEPSASWTIKTIEDSRDEPDCSFFDDPGFYDIERRACLTFDFEIDHFRLQTIRGPIIDSAAIAPSWFVPYNDVYGRLYDRPESLGAGEVECVDPSNDAHPVPVIEVEPPFVVVGEGVGWVESRVSFDPPFCAGAAPADPIEASVFLDNNRHAQTVFDGQPDDFGGQRFEPASGLLGVYIVDDSRPEADEALQLLIRFSDSSGLPERYTDYPGALWTIVIEDDEAAPVVMDGCDGTTLLSSSPWTGLDSTAPDLRVQEGVPCHVSVTLTKALHETATVMYRTVARTAHAGSDFTHVEGTVTFAPNETRKAIELEVLRDALDDDNEIFFFELHDASSNVFLADDRLELHIGTLPVPTIDVGDLTVTEGDIRLAYVPFTYAGTETRPTHVASFGLRLVQRAVHGKPFGTVPSGSARLGGGCPESGDALWNSADVPGLQRREVFFGTLLRMWVSACEDDLVEGDEIVEFEIHSLAGAVSRDRYGTITIVDNDDPPELAWTNTAADEGDTVTVAVTLAGSPRRERDATVEWATVDGSAAGIQPGGQCTTGNGDYVKTSGTLTFTPDETAQTITVNTCEDTVSGSGRDFYVEFSAPSLAALPAGDGRVRILIRDDD